MKLKLLRTCLDTRGTDFFHAYHRPLAPPPLPVLPVLRYNDISTRSAPFFYIGNLNDSMYTSMNAELKRLL